MSIVDLRGLLALVEEAGDLCRVTAEVDPLLEIAAITDRVSKGAGGGRALLFENVRGYPFAVLTNLFGSRRRTSWALWTDDIEALARRIAREIAAGSGSGAARLQALVEDPAYLPRLVASAPCQQVIHRDGPLLQVLPALQAWPGDGGRFLTLPLVFTRDPGTGRTNCGMYRVQLFDDNCAAIDWRRGSDGYRHHAAWSARGKRMPVAIALGGDPALIYAAAAPVPTGVDEVSFAGYLRQVPVAMARCLSCDLEVPAAAEFVIEGYFVPGETRPSGPFGNHSGRYVPASPAPLFHVTAVTHRRDALYPCTVVGPPPMEDCFLAQATERLFLPLLRVDHPQIVDVHSPMEGIFHGCTLISMTKKEPGGGRAIALALWRRGRLKDARLLVIVDADVDVHNPSQVFWHTINTIDPRRDLRIDGLRIAIDATVKLAGEEGCEPPSPRVEADEATLALLAARWEEYGIDGSLDR
ncbi:ubiD family decarboxylase [Desulfuromonas soudanensis]|uniref:UbiD family decarboxylase n=1 Tax=Desulfuromonas soudanensis TaxID=1603606 RepID=A0A0M3QEU2_9BACT|nr:UbiD family decarboxylase [Desulfuromonas soudanensis]ALC15069.1 ubiD family decarboxylase [Desulfuromonas soudanensis]